MRKPKVNTELRQWARGVSFTIAMGRRQVYTLVGLHLSRDIESGRRLMVGHQHRHMRDFVGSAHCLIDRGLVDAVVWRDMALQKNTTGKKFGELWRLTRAGELVVELLQEAGIYQEVREDLERWDTRLVRMTA